MSFQKYFSVILATSTVMIMPIYVGAQSSQNQSNIMTNDNSLGNTGVVNQTAVYNLGQSATYGFRGIVCPRPSLVFSGSMNGNTFDGEDSNSYAFSGAIIIPIGGQVGRNCTEFSSTLLAREQAELERFQVESSAEIVRLCSNMISAGIQVDPEVYPILAQQCSAVRLVSQGRSPNNDVSLSNELSHTQND
jgi:hypothetical protein